MKYVQKGIRVCTGYERSWKVIKFENFIFQAWELAKSMKFNCWSWKFMEIWYIISCCGCQNKGYVK